VAGGQWPVGGRLPVGVEDGGVAVDVVAVALEDGTSPKAPSLSKG
jgi:hypothetical protein